ncbi:MAG: hypothetical protein R3F59_36730 [Myxococcota bacterium]
MSNPSPLLLTLALGAYVLVAWRSPEQAPPALTAGGLRWRLLHTRPLRPRHVLPLLGVLAVLTSGWVVLTGTLLALVQRPGPSPLLTLLQGMDELVLWAPLAGLVAAIGSVPWLVRRAWTRIEADPATLRVVRPWPRRSLALPWSAVRDVQPRGRALEIRTDRITLSLEAPAAEPAQLSEVATWMRATAAAPAPPVTVPPMPRALAQLREH